MRNVWGQSFPLPLLESVRFHISQIMIEPQVERVHFLERIARPYVDKKLSLSDINKLIHVMNQSLMARGFSTSRIVVLEQNPLVGRTSFRSSDRLYQRRSFRRGQ